MLIKAVIVAMGLIALWIMARRSPLRSGSKPSLPSEDLVRCRKCGAYRLPGAPCECPDA